jgi:hypothetical protein
MDINSDSKMDLGKFDYRCLVSLIAVLRRDSMENTNLIWIKIKFQILLAGFFFTIVSFFTKDTIMGIYSGDIIFLITGIIGYVINLYLQNTIESNWTQVQKYNESCKQLEEHLPIEIRDHAVMHTYYAIEKKPGFRPTRTFINNFGFLLNAIWICIVVGFFILLFLDH